MLPKKVKLLIPIIAIELNLPEYLVRDAVDFYYEEVRRNLTQMKEPVLVLEGLGSFMVKGKELPKLYMKFTTQLDSLKDAKTQVRIKIKEDIESKLSNVQTLQKKIADEHRRKKEFLKRKGK